ncbi:transposase zinc-binding domain-containing protein [uncultured Thiohalocapsa sp.]|uniref:transposase zinc-binding domain-containing protein n=1 Tax=uncultured Thiohalocapsa sp. TaxID=768990 RepID=UPI00345DC97F
MSAYVERECRRYPECGILAYGVARGRCPDCGHGLPVAFSCKGRGCAHRATPGGWRRARRTGSITSSRRRRCAGRASRCPNGCAGPVEIRGRASRR